MPLEHQHPTQPLLLVVGTVPSSHNPRGRPGRQPAHPTYGPFPWPGPPSSRPAPWPGQPLCPPSDTQPDGCTRPLLDRGRCAPGPYRRLPWPHRPPPTPIPQRAPHPQPVGFPSYPAGVPHTSVMNMPMLLIKDENRGVVWWPCVSVFRDHEKDGYGKRDLLDDKTST